ncbi:MAG: hypothetical protein WCK05_02150 [Planctomycetota bacterium]
MHVVECPSCSSLLKVPKPVANARLKCRKCGVVFAGTSRQMADPAASAPAPPPTPPRTFQNPVTFRAPPRNNSTMIGVTVVAGVVLVGLVVAVHSTWKDKKAPEPAPKVQAPEPVRPAPAPAPKPQSSLFSISSEPDPAVPPATPPVPVPAAPPAPAPTPAPVAGTPIENLPIECRITRIGLTGLEQPYLQGGIRNDRAEGIKSATIEVRLPYEGKQVLVKIECSYIAPRATVPFLVSCPVQLAADFRPEALVAAVVPLAPKQICWAVEDTAVKGDDASEIRTVTGSVRNPQDLYVSNIEVYADVYFSDGRSAGPTIKGKLEHGNSLPPAGRDDFSLSFTPISVGTRMQRPIVRVVGTLP